VHIIYQEKPYAQASKATGSPSSPPALKTQFIIQSNIFPQHIPYFIHFSTLCIFDLASQVLCLQCNVWGGREHDWNDRRAHDQLYLFLDYFVQSSNFCMSWRSFQTQFS